MAKKVEKTAPGSENEFRITYDSGSKKWTNDRPDDGIGDPDELEDTFDDLTVRRGLKKLEKAVMSYAFKKQGGDKDPIVQAAKDLEIHAGSEKAKASVRAVRKDEQGVKGRESVVKGLDVAMEYLNRDRKKESAMKITAYMREEPPTVLHRIALDILKSLWEYSPGLSFHERTDISFINEPSHNAVKMKVYTDKNVYSITVSWDHDEDPTEWYLGCTASSDFHRPTEDWTRGSDLPDGTLSLKTWMDILTSIASYEMLDISEYIEDRYYESD